MVRRVESAGGIKVQRGLATVNRERSTTKSSGESHEDLANSVGHLGCWRRFHDGQSLQPAEHRAFEKKIIRAKKMPQLAAAFFLLVLPNVQLVSAQSVAGAARQFLCAAP